MPDWVTRTYDGYDERQKRNTFVWDLFSGDALDKARDKAQEIAQEEGLELNDDGEFQPSSLNRRPDLGDYLYRRAQGENPAAFSERARISKFPKHMSTIIGRHVGAVQLAGYKKNQWVDEETGEGPLGDPTEDGTVADHLKDNADGRETSWRALQRKGLRRCVLNLRVWFLCDGRTDEIPQPRAMLLDDASVTGKMERGGRLTDVIVTEEVDARDSIRDEPGTETRYIHYNLDGYRRFDDDGEPIVDPDIQPGGERVPYDNPFWETSDRERRILPVGYVDLNLDEDVPKSIAHDQEYLFNELSDIRMILRLAAHPKLHLNAEDQEYEQTVRALLAGANLVRGESAEWLIPDYDQIKSAYDQYRDEVQEMYDTAYQELNEAAKEKTATEMEMKDQRGRQAFLVHLSDRADELEQAMLWRLAQLEAPNSPELWDVIDIERSRDYAPVDPNAEAKSLKELYFPGDQNPVPASQSTKKQAAMEIAELQGIPEEDEGGLEAAITVGGGRPSDRRMSDLQQRVRSATNGEE